MSFLFTLPECLSVDIFKFWCQPKGLAKLDSSFCNRDHRHQLLDIFQLPYFVLPEVDTESGSKWLVRRQTKFLKLNICVDSMRRIFHDNILNSSCIESIVIKSYQDTAFHIYAYRILKLVDSCPNLFSLTIENLSAFGDFFFPEISPHILRNLRTFKISEYGEPTTSLTLQHIAKYCVNLKSFDLSSVCDVFDDRILKLIISKNSNLFKSFTVTSREFTFETQYSDSLLDCLSDCSQLCSCKIENCMLFGAESIANLILKCKHLTYFAYVDIMATHMISYMSTQENLTTPCVLPVLSVSGNKGHLPPKYLNNLLYKLKGVTINNIQFEQIDHIDDETMSIIGHQFNSLLNFNTINCQGSYNSNTIENLLKKCPKLTFLERG
jgi:hypothetical protein